MESSTMVPTEGQAINARTMAEAFLDTVERHGDRIAVRTHDDAVALTWSELRDRVQALAGGLAKLGLERGQTVALVLGNRPEFHVADLAAVMLGATPFSIYETYTPEQARYVVSDAGARIVITQESHLETIQAARRELPDLEHVILVDGEGGEGTVALSEVEASGSALDLEAAARAVEPDDVLTLIYTSGTTGPPKGVELSHRNLLSVVAGVQALIQLEPGARVISWLPAAHIAERMAHHYLPAVFGAEITTCPNPREIVPFLPQVHPNWFFAVPRIWEKLKSGLEAMLAAQPEEQQKPMRDALAAALEKVHLEQRGEPVPDELAERVAKTDAEVFAGLRAGLGLAEVVTVNVGAAPTPPEVLEFFHAIGIELAELWGMSETCGYGTVNPPGRVKIGTVGPAAPGVELRLAEDGEVLMRGECVMLGYRNLPERTAEAIDDDGWLHTGDIGELDDDGYLKIVDRKKEIIINAAGKNMSPANIESTLKGASPLVGQACVIGDGRRYNTALIVLDDDFAPVWAKERGVEGSSLAELAADETVREGVQEAVDAGNAKLSRVEQIKKFTLVRGDWAPGGEELTPTMKLRRKPIAEKYAEEIEAMY